MSRKKHLPIATRVGYRAEQEGLHLIQERPKRNREGVWSYYCKTTGRHVMDYDPNERRWRKGRHSGAVTGAWSGFDKALELHRAMPCSSTSTPSPS